MTAVEQKAVVKVGEDQSGARVSGFKHRKLLSSHGAGCERYGKGVRKSRQVWVRETNASEPLMRPRNRSTDGI